MLLNSFWLIVHSTLGMFGIGFIIGFHELGHFLFCKLFQVSTPSFSIGFGPRLITKKIGETVFSLSAIPLGGYVEIAGAVEVGQGDQEQALRNDQYSFSSKPFYQQFLIMIAGIAFNIIFAYTTAITLCLTGLPKTALLYPMNAIPVIQVVEPQSAADKAGLKTGDRIISVNNTPVDNNVKTVLATIKPLANQQATFDIQRNNKKQKITVTLGEREILGEKQGMLGVGFEFIALPPYPFRQAITQGVRLTNKWIADTAKAFIYIVRKRETKAVAGPLMMISLTIKGAAAGLKTLFLLLAIISINLAILNLLPLPIFDGGQILFYGIEAVMGRSLPARVRETIHVATWLMLLVLIVFLTYQDIVRIAGTKIAALLNLVGLG